MDRGNFRGQDYNRPYQRNFPRDGPRDFRPRDEYQGRSYRSRSRSNPGYRNHYSSRGDAFANRDFRPRNQPYIKDREFDRGSRFDRDRDHQRRPFYKKDTHEERPVRRSPSEPRENQERKPPLEIAIRPKEGENEVQKVEDPEKHAQAEGQERENFEDGDRSQQEEEKQNPYKADETSPRDKDDDDSQNNCNVYIAGIPRKTTEDQLRKKFSSFGSIQKVSLIHDLETGQPRGFAYILYGKTAEAELAIKEMDGTKPFNDWPIKVEFAKR